MCQQSRSAPQRIRFKEAAIMARLEVLCPADDPNTFFRACVNCGKRTGNYCDGASWRNACLAAYCIPSEESAQGQSTLLCNACETRFSLCRFCLGIHSATPPTWGEHPMDRRVPWTWGKVNGDTACPAETHRTHVMVPKGTAEAAGSKGDPQTMKLTGPCGSQFATEYQPWARAPL